MLNRVDKGDKGEHGGSGLNSNHPTMHANKGEAGKMRSIHIIVIEVESGDPQKVHECIGEFTHTVPAAISRIASDLPKNEPGAESEFAIQVRLVGPPQVIEKSIFNW